MNLYLIIVLFLPWILHFKYLGSFVGCNHLFKSMMTEKHGRDLLLYCKLVIRILSAAKLQEVKLMELELMEFCGFLVNFVSWSISIGCCLFAQILFITIRQGIYSPKYPGNLRPTFKSFWWRPRNFFTNSVYTTSTRHSMRFPDQFKWPI